jgi:transposase
MAKNMELVINESFPESQIFTDRFHVVKLAMNAVQHVSIKQRWKELDKENDAIHQAKQEDIPDPPCAAKWRYSQITIG